MIGDRLGQRYSRFASLGTIDKVEVTQATTDGRVLRIAVCDQEGGRLELDAESFRLTVDPTGRLVQSTRFVVVDDGEAIILAGGRGMGHGMGMCQYGANAMAEGGQEAGAILRHYFPGAKLTRAY
jgi:stage II sporulation protein D